MKIDLQIHTRTCSDGNLSIEEVFEEAKSRGVELISITDHDSVDCQAMAISLARAHGISYITGVELNVTFQYTGGKSAVGVRDDPDYGDHPGGKPVSLDFLGYRYDIYNHELKSKLQVMKRHREKRARQILENLNAEFDKEGMERFTEEDLRKIQGSVDGVFGRPHIANYLIKKRIVKDKQEAFDKYLVKCNVPKYPLSLAEASRLIRDAGGILVLAHPNDPNGTSLVSITRDLEAQTRIIEEHMLDYINGVECWHSRHDAQATQHYIEFAGKHSLIMTGGSDCHQQPVLIGTLDIPGWVAEQFAPARGRRLK
ncbi:MAG: 3',5'-nucleoside bisphosphate phosphatase [Dehalococcoidia bacterium]|nr:3',5'-nucleoside bisphosphate phosphatase [Chloroflexota bacterium]